MTEGTVFTGVCHSFCPQGEGIWSEGNLARGGASGQGAGCLIRGWVWSKWDGMVRSSHHPPTRHHPPPHQVGINPIRICQATAVGTPPTGMHSCLLNLSCPFLGKHYCQHRPHIQEILPFGKFYCGIQLI